jgi:hypothetical protein
MRGTSPKQAGKSTSYSLISTSLHLTYIYLASRISVCDLPDKFDALKLQYADVPGITVYPDGHAVSRISDFIMYSVEAEYIDRVVSQYGPCTTVFPCFQFLLSNLSFVRTYT